MLNRRPPPPNATQPNPTPPFLPHHPHRVLYSLREEAAESVENTEAPPPNLCMKSSSALLHIPRHVPRWSPGPQRQLPKYLKQTDLYMAGTKSSNINTSSGLNKSSFLSSDFTSTASCILFQSWSSFVFGFRPDSVPHSQGVALAQRKKLNSGGRTGCSHIWPTAPADTSACCVHGGGFKCQIVSGTSKKKEGYNNHEKIMIAPLSKSVWLYICIWK